LRRRCSGFGMALVAVALVALAASAPAHAATRRLAVVASQNSGGHGTTPLRYADADAFKVRDVLVQLCGFDAELVRFLPDAGRAELVAALAEATRRARAYTEAGDAVLLLVFYSGHADRDGLLLGRSRLSFEELDGFVELSGAQVKLQLVDACHSGAATRSKGATPVPSFLVDVDSSLASQGRVVIASSAADEYSQESDAIGASFFTHFMVSGLRGAADADGDLRVTLDELYRHLYDETLYHTAGTRTGPQHPEYDFDLSGQGTLVLADLRVASASLVFPPDEEGRYTVFDRRRRAYVGEIGARGGPVRLAVAPGAYIVQRRDPDHLGQAEVRLDTGDEVDVDGLVLEEHAYTDDVAKGLALRWKRRTRAVIRAGGGVHAVLQTRMREDYFPTLPLVSLGAGIEWRGRPRSELIGDVSFGRAEYALPGYFDQRAAEAHLDIGVSYRLVEDLSGFRLAIGPRFAMLTYQRTPPGDFLAGFSIGLDGGIGLRFRDNVGVALDARVGYLLNHTALENQSHVHLQTLLRLDLAL
jgi:hypothetical protein